jgi:hypothetical protein
MKINLDIPTRLSEITLRQYKKYLEVLKDNEGDRFLDAKMIQIFCGAKLDEVMRLHIKDSEQILNIISELFNQKPALVSKFKLGKIEYGFHPELDELTLGEYIDLDSYISDWDNMERAMNVLYRPVIVKLKDKYSIEDYNIDTYNNLLDMPMDAVMSAIFFLWNLGLELSQVMMNSLEQDQTTALTQYLNSQKSGDGISQFMDSLTETLGDLKISLN